MRRSVLTLILALLVTGVLVAPAAQAGGPTSVLVAAPGQAAAGLYYSDADYARLSELVQVGRGGGAAPSGRSQESGDYVTLTWLIHDVTPWRVDRVYRHADGAAWVATQEDLGGGDLWAVDPVWRRADPALLRLLDRVLADGGGGPAAATTEAPAPAAPVDDPAPAAAPAAAAAASEPDDLLTGSVGGLVVAVGVGLLAGAALVILVQRLRTRSQGVAAHPAAAAEGPAPDRLAWP